MKAKIVKEVKRSDGLWRFACGDVFKRISEHVIGNLWPNSLQVGKYQNSINALSGCQHLFLTITLLCIAGRRFDLSTTQFGLGCIRRAIAKNMRICWFQQILDNSNFNYSKCIFWQWWQWWAGAFLTGKASKISWWFFINLNKDALYAQA